MGGAVHGAIAQAWPPFVLVAGLLLIGAVVEADGLFAAVGARVERMPGGSVALLGAVLALEAVVTALLNLDTAVFMVNGTSILRHGPPDAPALARRDRADNARAAQDGALRRPAALGTLARRWDGPARLLRHLDAPAVLVNNLPAAALLSAQRPPHPLPLLVGLNLGPSLAFTGSR
jgi:hypothetical protein